MTAAPADFLLDEQLREIEQLAAAEIVMKMRSVQVLNRTMTNPERAKYAQVFQRLSNEFQAAATLLRRVRPDNEVPPTIAEGSTVDLNESRRRKTA
jgi:xanthine dehydrogenase iron-sulfur cluster and FAD-binding subunit A